MKLNIKLKNKIQFLCITIFALMFTSCQPTELGEGNGLTDSDLDASFTITPVSGENNTYILTANNSYISSSWDLGTGAGFYSGGDNEEVFFPDAGIYTISHKVVGKGGVSEIFSQELDVEISDPVAGNIIEGGKFLDAADHAKWTVYNISASGAQLVFNSGSATMFSSGDWAQQGIYQAVEVVQNKEYSIDMLVSGGDNFSNTWFEVYAGTTPPVQGQEYHDNKIMGLSTWDGCATSAFSGQLSNVGCVKNSNTDSINNKVTFTESGTIYLVIRSGGEHYDPAGITIKNVEMRGSD